MSTRTSTAEQILQIASELLHQRGYANTSTGDIASATGIAKGNLAYHFPTRRELLAGVAQRREDRLRQLIADWSLACTTVEDCIGRVISMMENSADQLAAHGCPHGSMAAELGKTDLSLRTAGAHGLELLVDWVAARFGSFLPLEEARGKAEFVVSALQGAALLAYCRQDPGLVSRQAAELRIWLANVCEGR